MKTKLKKVTYNGLIYTVEQIRFRNDIEYYWLSGATYWIESSECTHWLAGWFYKFFKGEWSKLLKR